jgi:hypothetical protein
MPSGHDVEAQGQHYLFFLLLHVAKLKNNNSDMHKYFT